MRGSRSVHYKRDIWYGDGNGSKVVVSPGGPTVDYTEQSESPTPTGSRTVINSVDTSEDYNIQANGTGSTPSDSSSSSGKSTPSSSLGPHKASSSDSSNLSAGPIVGIVVGVIAFFVFLFLCFGKYRRRMNRQKTMSFAKAQGMARSQPHYAPGAPIDDGSFRPTTFQMKNTNGAMTVKSQHSKSGSDTTNLFRKGSTASSLVPSDVNSLAAAPWFRSSGATTEESHSDVLLGMSRSDSDRSRYKKGRNSFGSPLDMLVRGIGKS
ncbi:hypothetical protein E3Q22_03051 [Wallemia mellicola]|uniref:Mid2 domain-containing protein n=2 Tax=Wallemia mellicola TaxID=1708541 RepID=A0A4T0QH73_9BASI|nr:hypothetical protein WALSEDRAFT_55002 [Wallemia mellicola CBS 633.66]TIB71871.1 hypothetical protein E3Q24_02014 [Wallemia mellicola]EIM20552.1 hypothetical protein WALSEDRAFT_55002 [Wallemia mellicola CBS 633.66]TIB77430.1 hypothetical protein E3Q22_03051 [Wallemia mellicola]TIB90836.1 hypothetical protein E3Q19_02627 [Wallemia mellicola]TIB98586.1 hypothetical protein E3Q18_02019 [Wallemia mellicola]|eukprot:XP_006959346.1 hypothetical protein WALSEDRAFT_55002 [Wallemia mellicola CBS 633.66]